MIRGRLAIGIVVLLVVSGCASEQAGGEGAVGTEPIVGLNGESATNIEERVRASVDASLDGARQELAAVEAAQSSVSAASADLEQGLTRLSESDERDALLEELGRHRERSTQIQERVEQLSGRLEQFEARALVVLDDEASTQDPGRLDGLESLDAEAEGLTSLIVPLMRSSDAVVRDVTLLSTEVAVLVGPAGTTTRVAGMAAPAAVTSVVEPGPPMASELVAELRTSKGTIVLEFFPDLAPRHVENFFSLVRTGFYDDLTFHRVVPGFVVQGGCPEGTGAGGPGWEIPAEFSDRHHERGTLSMARMAHPDSAGSQFFLCLGEWRELDGRYTVFGQMIRGEEALVAIERVGTVSGVPVEPVTIETIELRMRTPEESKEAS